MFTLMFFRHDQQDGHDFVTRADLLLTTKPLRPLREIKNNFCVVLPVEISCCFACFDSLDLTLAHPCGARRAVALLSKTPPNLRRFCG